jgi:hypothetical protein
MVPVFMHILGFEIKQTKFPHLQVTKNCLPTYPIRMSHWHQQIVDSTEFWISCKRLAFLSTFSHLNMIQNSAPSTIC